ncbi:unnamed protein product [Phytophthora fragariaefolia]|uniref:Unnamed protein product n=1 Tax=Phytophthora fragariaefolia TaxID=1490495 RepID=A0A9W6U757_9STRA|nr:unnamed protein product [Phytophthora fragariaefolia]
MSPRGEAERKEFIYKLQCFKFSKFLIQTRQKDSLSGLTYTSSFSLQAGTWAQQILQDLLKYTLKPTPRGSPVWRSRGTLARAIVTLAVKLTASMTVPKRITHSFTARRSIPTYGKV